MHAHPRTISFLLMVLASTATTGLRAEDVRGQGVQMVQEATATVGMWPREPYYYVQSGVSLDQAAQMAQSRFNAKVVKAETVRSGDRRVHQIRLLNAENKVFTVRVDAETGQMF